MKYLIFDFNGTIVNDVELSLESFNYCAKKYMNMDPVTLEEYRRVFSFPTKNSYIEAGFDFDKVSWEEVANCWFEHYDKHHHECKIFDGVIEIINKAHQLGYKCVILSASEINILKEQLKELKIYDLFDDVIGIDNIYGTSKIDSAKEYFEGIDLKDSLLIGDTDHDKAVADELKCKCILVSSGHQSYDKLIKVNDIVYNTIKDVKL